MRSPFKFPRRVRIHGGECDAVARALHHEAQKVALTQDEQTLISDEKAFLSQADSKKAFGSTSFERKQMSTKTSIKRIALVAVSALGFGLLSVVPAKAALTPSTTLSASAIARAGLGMQLTVTRDGTGGTEYVHFVKTGTLPSGGLVSAYKGSVTGTNLTATYDIADDTGATPETNKFVAGTYNLLVWIDTTNSVTTSPASGAVFTRIAVTVGGTPSVITLTGPSTSVASNTTPNAKFVASLTDSNGVSTLLDTTLESLSVKATFSNGTAKLGKVAGTSVSTFTSGTGVAFTDGTNVVSDDSTYPNNYTFYVSNTTGTSTTVAVSGGGLLSGITGGSSTLTTVTKTYPTAIDLSGGAAYSATARTIGTTSGLGSGLYPHMTQVTGAGTTALTASTKDGLSATFEFTGTAADVYDVTVGAINSTTALPSGIVAGTYTTSAIAAADTTVDYTITATAASAGQGYKVTVPLSATTNAVFTITYEAPTVNSTKGTITLVPASTASAKATIGDSVAITATVKDQFNKAFAGANVVYSGMARTASTAAVSATTNASGVATYTLVDTKSTSTTESITVSASAPNETAQVSGSTTIAFGTAAANAVSSLSVSNNNDATNGDLIDASLTETAVVKNAAGAVLQGIPVTFALSSGLYGSTTTTVYSDGSGVATYSFSGRTVGTGTITVTAGGKSATDSALIITSNAKSRTISLDSATVTLNGSSTVRVTATVKDGYGNAVSGQSLSVAYAGTAGRVSAVGGLIATSGTTKTDGTMTVDISAASASEVGSGTLTITGTMGNASTSTLNADGVTALPAKAAKATSTVTVTASTAPTAADAVAAANAATAAAKAASDAAVAAAKAAQDAAVAAAQKAAADAVAAAKAAQDAAVAQAKAAKDAADAASDAALEAIDAGTAATDAANLAAEAADAATMAAQDAKDAADAATAAVEKLAQDVATMIDALKAQLATLANVVAKIAKKVKA